ncbi:floral homeotic protein GLOBOSA-like isoform X2 [Corylus avellana]|uniref:floral homeotic protein GLOBOSA-like isoform X2 n=1 Tax=Corylus avellana TaxID=13451 RepID=UPI00286CC996|nr:floral homeotic protein GLOBOSA-like isoform X2 [Corylus avellana]
MHFTSKKNKKKVVLREMERGIENPRNRHVTYSKRRNGIIKKATEISVLCDAQVSLVILNSSGKISSYCSPSTSLSDVLDKYHRYSGKRLWDPKHENLSNEIDRIKKENDIMQIELRYLNGEDITSLNPRELILLEEALENGISSIRERQRQQEMAMEAANREME